MRIAYVPNGPLWAERDATLAARLVTEMTVLARSLGVNGLIVQPSEIWDDLDAELALHHFGRAPIDVATTSTIVVDLAPDLDELLAGLRSSRRRNIRRAERLGATFRVGDAGDLETFHRLHSATAARQGFTPLSLDYLRRQWAVLGRRDLLKVFLVDLEGQTVAGATATCFGDTVIYKLAGWDSSGDSAAARPNDLLHWQIIEWAHENGFSHYDMGGFERVAASRMLAGEEMPEEFRSTPAQFKLGFGGTPVVRPLSSWALSPRVLRFVQPMVPALAEGRGRLGRFVSGLRSG